MSEERQDKKYKESEEFVDNFIEFISDCNDFTSDELERNLQDEGVDVSSLIKNIQQMVDGALEKDRLSWQEKAQNLRKTSSKKFLEGKLALLNLSKGEMVNRLKSICQTGEPDFSFAHRNLKPEDLSEEELREILSEYEQLGDGE
jgi:hypothetical protein